MPRFQVFSDTLEVEESGGYGSESLMVSYVVDSETGERTDEHLSVPQEFRASHKRIHDTGVGVEEAYAFQLAVELNGLDDDGYRAALDARKRDLGFVPEDDVTYESPVIHAEEHVAESDYWDKWHRHWRRA